MTLEESLENVRKTIIDSNRSMFIISALNPDNSPLWLVTNDPRSGTKYINLPKQENGAITSSGNTLQEALNNFMVKMNGEK